MKKHYIYGLKHSRRVVESFLRSMPRVLYFLIKLYNFTQENAIEVYRTDQKRWRDLKKICWYLDLKLRYPPKILSVDREGVLTRSFPGNWYKTLKKQIRAYMASQPPIVKIRKIKNFGKI